MNTLVLCIAFWTSVVFAGREQCVTCNNSESCCGGTHCCGVGDMCCDSYSESCCPDPVNGSICCLAETTFCCPRQDPLPSHCCPRWMVCCLYGRYGCCNPGAKRAVYHHASLPQHQHQHEATASKKRALKSNVYAMFEIPTWTAGMPNYGMTLDTSSGYAVTSANITAPYNNWGELSRTFAFDGNRKFFYLIQATFVPVNKYPEGKEPLNLYTIDPVTGGGNKTAVSGATGLVTGLLYDARKDVIIFATYKWNAQYTQKIGYSFYTLNMRNPRAAVLKSSSLFPSGTDDYVGWFRSQNEAGLLLRLGYRDVINSIGFGLGMTDISKPVTTTTFEQSFVQYIPQGFEKYATITPFQDCFLSLAPSDTLQLLSVILWNLNGTIAKVVADLGDSNLTPWFGPVLEAIDLEQTTYSALVVYVGVVIDTWSLVVMDLSNFDTNVYTISPPEQGLNAETDSPFGLGFAV